jgi:predicted chitinase
MTRAVEIVRKVAPQAQASYLAAFENGDGLLRQHDVTTPERLAHFLAQILHETGGLRLEHESMNYRAERIMEIFGVGRHSAAIRPAEAQNLAHNERALAERVYGLGNPGKAAELGNTQAGDGFRFRGGGLMQTTGRANYRDTGRRCGVDFEAHPEFVLSAEHALKPALVEWKQQRLNVLADNNDILAISRAINCGSAKSKKIPNGMQDRTTWFARVRPLIASLTVQGAAPPSEPASTGTDATAPSQVDTIPAISPLVGGAILRLNDQGPVVRAAQRALARLGRVSPQGHGLLRPDNGSRRKGFSNRPSPRNRRRDWCRNCERDRQRSRRSGGRRAGRAGADRGAFAGGGHIVAAARHCTLGWEQDSAHG